MSDMTRLVGEVDAEAIQAAEERVHRINCPAPGIRNHNGTPKPVVSLTPEGFWAFCRWSREMEFISKEQCREFWTRWEASAQSAPQDLRPGDEVVVRLPGRVLARIGKVSYQVEVDGTTLTVHRQSLMPREK